MAAAQRERSFAAGHWNHGPGHQWSLPKISLQEACDAATPLPKQSGIEQSVIVRLRLFPGGIGVQVPWQFHGVVQYPTDNE
jgi:hypothetical protein